MTLEHTLPTLLQHYYTLFLRVVIEGPNEDELDRLETMDSKMEFQLALESVECQDCGFGCHKQLNGNDVESPYFMNMENRSQCLAKFIESVYPLLPPLENLCKKYCGDIEKVFRELASIPTDHELVYITVIHNVYQKESTLIVASAPQSAIERATNVYLEEGSVHTNACLEHEIHFANI